MPFERNSYYHPGVKSEADREAVNHFIRTSGVFDAVIDFDRLMRDPLHADRLAPAYDSGDHLHPSEMGYRVMGEAVPLSLFQHQYWSRVPHPSTARVMRETGGESQG
jgi:lysophospholipase L1-like esterase